MNDHALDDEGAGEAASFPHARTVPVLGRLLIEHHIPRDHHLASLGIIKPIGLAALLVAQEHHRRAPVFQLAEVRLGVLHMADAAKCPEEGHIRLASMPSLERCLARCAVG